MSKPKGEDCILNLELKRGESLAEKIDYTKELQAIYDSEINFRLECVWDIGWKIVIGDEMNGFKYVTHTDTIEEAIEWLIETVRKKYPKSGYAKRLNKVFKETP